MAAVWVFRAIVYLRNYGNARVLTSTGAGAPGPLYVGRELYDRLRDPGESDEDLSAALSERNGYPVNVATYTGDFEIRRFHVLWSMISATGIDEDVRVCTFDLAKVSGGAPVDTWDAADFAAVLAGFDAWWSSIRVWFPSNLKWIGLKAYKAGPSVEPPQTSVYSATTSIAGSSAFNSLPPQVAVSVTEKAGTKLHWGRFYLPAPALVGPSGVYSCTAGGRPATEMITTFAGATNTMYDAALAASRPFVVYRPALPSRPQRSGPDLAARDASAWTVESIQCDDVFDVIRSRRYDRPQLRVQQAIG